MPAICISKCWACWSIASCANICSNSNSRRYNQSIRFHIPDETDAAERNANPKPYKWKAEGAEILSKLKRARVTLDKAEAA
jgi:hypothetical protein